MQEPFASHSELAGRSSRLGIEAVLRGISRGWRIVGTALSFTVFGVGSVLFAILAIPLIRFVPGPSRDREIRVQLAVHWLARFFLRVMWLFGVGRFECTGAEELQESGRLIVATHPTLIDAILLLSLMPQADCVVKGSHLKNPFLGGLARGAGYIPNWEGPGLVDECVGRLSEGRSLIIFPEGTRSPVGELGRFARGAAHIALRAGRDPIPVTIRCDPATLYRGHPWWAVPERSFTLSARVGAPLLLKDVVEPSMNPALAARALTRGMQRHFERELWPAASSFE